MTMNITTSNKGSHLELVAETHAVTRSRAFEVLRELADAVENTGIRRALVEVIAPYSELRLLDHVAIWNCALDGVLVRTQIAYVVTGRNVDADTLFAETFAHNRGLNLRFFSIKNGALPWLLSDPGLPMSSTQAPDRIKSMESGPRALASFR